MQRLRHSALRLIFVMVVNIALFVQNTKLRSRPLERWPSPPS